MLGRFQQRTVPMKVASLTFGRFIFRAGAGTDDRMEQPPSLAGPALGGS